VRDVKTNTKRAHLIYTDPDFPFATLINILEWGTISLLLARILILRCKKIGKILQTAMTSVATLV